MALKSVTVAEALERWSSFDAVIDARSPGEFALDHLPLAQNWPVLDNDERAEVGTEYKQVSAFDARKHGAVLVARRIADLLERHAQDKPRTWQPLVYCWRGGQRSGTLAWFLDQVGFRAHLLKGGYKAFRAQVRADLETLPLGLQWIVIGGRTGTGKSRLLGELAELGAQVLDLEALARHRGSVLGALPGQPQPSQKHFEMQVWEVLRSLHPERPVYVESESRKIGQLQVPEALILRMRSHGRVVLVDMPLPARIELLLQDYAHFASDVPSFCGLLGAMVELRGHERVQAWQQMAREGRWAEVFGCLVQEHYDPLYLKSMDRNFIGLEQAVPLAVEDASKKALRQAAQGLVDRLG